MNLKRKQQLLSLKSKTMLPSRVDCVQLRGRKFFVKRDDLIDPCLSGNKYRKLYTLVQTPSIEYTKIISYGGTQSNAMYSIACLCHAKGWEFHYYSKTLSKYLKEGAEGNLQMALEKGMHLHEVSHELFEEKIEELQSLEERKTLVISQGGADELAKEGISLLADEINRWKSENNIDRLTVVLPSGTGTTALYLNEALNKDINLYTSVLVGDAAYQIQQWQRLSSGPFPKIFPSQKKQKFAKPYDEYLQMHEELAESTGIVFDLIYAPRTWIEMLQGLKDDKGEILYIHTGGVSGNETMLERYRHKNSRKR